MPRASAVIRKFNPDNTAVPESVISVLRTLRRSLMSIEEVCSVVLFGSYSKGTYNNDSDIDIALFISDKSANKAPDIFRQAMRCVKEYPLDIQVLVFNEGTLCDPIGIVGEVVQFGADISQL